ncbi:uncharacterized protein LOC142339863 [Convolutriloba macropyga]|uniref:uncharacterized protein LOC142339863 n=1 Tax=Convolutriloba macropyga TaxID=536237 RepID=UPI003F523336
MDLGVSSMEVEVKQSGSGSSSGNKQKQICPPSYDESIDAPDCQLEVQSSEMGLQGAPWDPNRPLVDLQRDSWDEVSPRTQIVCAVCFAIVIAILVIVGLFVIFR